MSDNEIIHSLEDLKAVAAFVRERRAAINTIVPGAEFGRELLEQNTQLIDSAVRRLYELACKKILGEAAPPHGLAVAATGGYGRRELAPHSDVDVTFIPAREADETLNTLIKEMFQSVMDVFLYGANVRVGYAYRLLSDVAQWRLDHQTQTTLLDARLVVGDKALFHKFSESFKRHFLRADFLFQKSAERRDVLSKHGGDNVFQVEPDVKEGAGGLRDVHMVHWFAQILTPDACGQHYAGFIDRGFLSARDAMVLNECHGFLLTVRNVLQCLWAEPRDSLTAQKQEDVSRLMGYANDSDRPAVEAFMADYYQRSEEVQRISRKAIRRCLDSHLDLGLGGIASVDRKVTIVNHAGAQVDAALPLHAVEISQAYELGFGDTFDDDVADYLAAHPSPENLELCGRVFTRILSAPKGVGAALRRLADLHALEWAIPEFRSLRRLIPFDAAHDFTVGEHSLRVVEFLELLRTTNEPRWVDFRRVWDEVSFPELLMLAGLIHDIGKQWPSEESHSEAGANAAAAIAARLGWSEDRQARLTILVRNHLLMAETSRLRDLQLDETMRDFTKTIKDLDLLNMLFLLTCADTNSVGAGTWTDMRGKFLGELYQRARNVLEAAADANSEHGAINSFTPDLAKHKERVRRHLTSRNLPLEAIHEHTARMPAQYLLNTSLEDMYLHMAMIGRLRNTAHPTMDFRTEFGADFTEMTVVAYDDPRPGLLAKILGVLYALDVNLHGSQVFTRDSSVRIAMDTLWIDYRGRTLSSGKKAEIQETLRQVLMGKLGLDELLQKRKKPDKAQTIHAAQLDSESSDRYSLLEVRAPDELGVAFRLSSAISSLDWNIHSARVSVWGSLIRAAFYITSVDGVKIPDTELARLLDILPRQEYQRRRITPAAMV